MITKCQAFGIPWRGPRKKDKERLLTRQRGRCRYCQQELDEWYVKDGLAYKRKIHWDHVLPYSYSFNNEIENFVASCAECNLIKSSLVFDSLTKAIDYVQEKRRTKGLRVLNMQQDIAAKATLAEVLFTEVPLRLLLEDPPSNLDELERYIKDIKKLRRLLKNNNP